MPKDKWGLEAKPKKASANWWQRPRRSTKSDDSAAWRLLDKTLQSLVIEQRRARRWRIALYLMVIALVALIALPFSLLDRVQSQQQAQQWLSTPGFFDAGNLEQPHLALIRIQGMIAEGDVSAELVNAQLANAFTQPNARAVALLINSPGGSPVQAERIYSELLRLRARHNKPVYAVIDDLGASAAYYIAVGSEQIFANINSLVGSIGVVSPGFGFVGLMEKLGVERRVQTAGANKDFLDPFKELKPEDSAFWQAALEQIHANFISAVEQGRGAKLRRQADIYSGLIYTGESALQLGLIDGYSDVGSLARTLVGVEEIVDYSALSKDWISLLRDFTVSTIQRLTLAAYTPGLR